MRWSLVFVSCVATVSTAAAGPLDHLCEDKQNLAPTDNSQVLCFDYTREGEPPQRLLGGTANDQIVIWPNRQVVVRVIRVARPDEKITIALGGTPGETKLKIDGVDVLKSQDFASPLIKHIPRGEFEVYEARFVPRTTGHAPMTLTLVKKVPPRTPPDRPTPLDTVEHTRTDTGGTLKWTTSPPETEKTISIFEFLVPNVYSGAIRLGLSSVVGLHEHQYSKRQAVGVSVMEVIDHGATNVMAELVVGYAPYWQSFTGKRGRDYVRYYKLLSYERIAPYFGVGISSLNTSGEGTRVRWLRSFYIGGELELAQNISVAVALTLSRVDTLAHGLAVGGPVAKETMLTDTEFRPGLGIVVNFSPDFLKFAAGMK